jgi:hypothetical protein
MTVAAIAEFRAAQGRFAPGQSGNPGGRPKGSRNRATVLAEALLEDHAEPITRKIIDAAEAGDGAMLRLLFSRIVRSGRDRLVTLDIPGGKELDAEEVFRVTARALFDGEISPDEALRIGRFIALAARIRSMKARPAHGAKRPSPEKDLYSSKESPAAAGEGDAPLTESETPAQAGQPVSGQYFSRGASMRSPGPKAPQPGSTDLRRRGADGHRSSPHSALYFSRPPRAAGVVQPAS